MGVNTNRWREVHYVVGLGQAVKAVPPEEREGLFNDYGRYMDWIQTVPQEGDRQFRHMLRYFLFPDLVERMSSNRDRLRVRSEEQTSELQSLMSISYAVC